MASYSFKCNKCKKEFTIIKSMNDDSEIYCECGSKDVRRIYKSVSIAWKCEGSCGKVGK